MQSLETWLGARGSMLAQALDAQRDIICEHVARKLATNYPDLCPNLPAEDPELSQQIMFQQTPQRFHTMLLAALRFRTLAIVEREYRWLWGIVQRFGVERSHLLQQVHWYFEAARTFASLSLEDLAWLRALESAIEQIVLTITSVPPTSVQPPHPSYPRLSHSA
ncbi:hypothetical protein [Roseiflexus castenholzii]|uniref:hypothetical protein n=1 Tax=Roseiflexus castenholzii TaxID=120962 RepID=UPI003C7C309C